MALLQQDSDSDVEATLSQRIDDLLRSYEDSPLLSTTGTQAAISELAARTRGLEGAMREIALELQRLNASH
jgi:hypothetical protein